MQVDTQHQSIPLVTLVQEIMRLLNNLVIVALVVALVSSANGFLYYQIFAYNTSFSRKEE
jgi:hypothetical protein